MTTTGLITVVIGVWVGCLISEAFDDFRATRRLVREMVRQWAWVWQKVRKVAR